MLFILILKIHLIKFPTIIYMDKNTCINLYKSLVRQHLKYANWVWSPYKKGDVAAITNVQKGQPN